MSTDSEQVDWHKLSLCLSLSLNQEAAIAADISRSAFSRWLARRRVACLEKIDAKVGNLHQAGEVLPYAKLEQSVLAIKILGFGGWLVMRLLSLSWLRKKIAQARLSHPAGELAFQSLCECEKALCADTFGQSKLVACKESYLHCFNELLWQLKSEKGAQGSIDNLLHQRTVLFYILAKQVFNLFLPEKLRLKTRDQWKAEGVMQDALWCLLWFQEKGLDLTGKPLIRGFNACFSELQFSHDEIENFKKSIKCCAEPDNIIYLLEQRIHVLMFEESYQDLMADLEKKESMLTNIIQQISSQKGDVSEDTQDLLLLRRYKQRLTNYYQSHLQGLCNKVLWQVLDPVIERCRWEREWEAAKATWLEVYKQTDDEKRQWVALEGRLTELSQPHQLVVHTLSGETSGVFAEQSSTHAKLQQRLQKEPNSVPPLTAIQILMKGWAGVVNLQEKETIEDLVVPNKNANEGLHDRAILERQLECTRSFLVETEGAYFKLINDSVGRSKTKQVREAWLEALQVMRIGWLKHYHAWLLKYHPDKQEKTVESMDAAISGNIRGFLAAVISRLKAENESVIAAFNGVMDKTIAWERQAIEQDKKLAAILQRSEESRQRSAAKTREEVARIEAEGRERRTRIEAERCEKWARIEAQWRERQARIEAEEREVTTVCDGEAMTTHWESLECAVAGLSMQMEKAQRQLQCLLVSGATASEAGSAPSSPSLNASRDLEEERRPSSLPLNPR